MSVEVAQAAQFTIEVTPTQINVGAAAGMAVQGLPGPTGPVGPSGAAVPIAKLSAGVVNAGRVVRYADATHVEHASAMTLAHASCVAGVAVSGASAAEESVSVIRFGEATDSGWNWAPLLPVFLGADGVLTQSFSASWAFVLVVGVALSATRIAVDLQDPIKL